MTTNSLRKDHDLIEKVLKSMQTTIQLLNKGKQIPESILMPVVDFSKNFTNVCHHGKEEGSLFPALEKAGMPREGGPIAMMLMEHEITQKIANQIVESAKKYLDSGDSSQLISDMTEYVEHVSQHLWKENNRLFMMADMHLMGHSDKIEEELNKIEDSKLQEIGNNREFYEKLAEDLNQKTEAM
ncbi:MAG: hemerythrin domain-containing protein [Nitrosopumilaceae archaeon]